MIALGCAPALKQAVLVQDKESGLGAGLWALPDNTNSEQPYFEVRVGLVSEAVDKWVTVARVSGGEPTISWDARGAAAFPVREYGETHRILRLEYSALSTLECPSTSVLVRGGAPGAWGIHVSLCSK